jgi:glycolate oxidase iron-sulfur subunit
MKALASGQLSPTEAGDLHLDHCLGCRRCESVCPANVQYGALLAGARARQFERPMTGVGGYVGRRWTLWLLASPRALTLLLKGYRALFPLLPAALRPLPRPPVARPVAGEAAASTALFVGCIAQPFEAPARAALIRLLAAVGEHVAIPAGQNCCGTAAVHAGDSPRAGVLAEQNRAAFAGHSNVLTLASGCQETLQHSLDSVARVDDAVEFLEQRGESLRFRSARGRRVALHLPCTQRSVTRSDAALRRLLARVPDLALIELPDTGCCGAAGLHMLEEPARAAALRVPLLKSMADSGADELLSANIGCRLHLGNASDFKIRHPVELLAELLE